MDEPAAMELPVCVPGAGGRCAVCADEGEIGRVVELQADGLALVELPAGRAEVALDLVPEARVGDAVIVHLGFALARIDEGVERRWLAAAPGPDTASECAAT